MPVCCYLCKFTACRSCVQRCILDSSDDPTCSDCKGGWTRDFLMQSFTKSWMNNAYKAHRENLIFERQRATFPGMMHLIELSTSKKELFDRELELATEIARIDTERKSIKRQFHRVSDELSAGMAGSKRRATGFMFSQLCLSDGCGGFLNREFKCPVCLVGFCRQCHLVKADSDHVCAQGDVDTVALIRSQSKPCPKCQIPISKIEGCNQVRVVVANGDRIVVG